MVYNMTDLVSYARSRDGRLEDTYKYTDAMMEVMIEEAFAVAQDIRPIFAATETYDLEANVLVDLLTEMEIILQKEPQSIRAVVDFNDTFFDYEITANNHIIVRVSGLTTKPDDNNYKMTVKYFYYPLLPITQIELSIDAYRLVKEAINIVVFTELRDYEQEQYHRNKAKLMAQESSYDLEKNTLVYPEARFVSGAWV